MLKLLVKDIKLMIKRLKIDIILAETTNLSTLTVLYRRH